MRCLRNGEKEGKERKGNGRRKKDRGEVLLFSLNIKFSKCMMLRSAVCVQYLDMLCLDSIQLNGIFAFMPTIYLCIPTPQDAYIHLVRDQNA